MVVYFIVFLLLLLADLFHLKSKLSWYSLFIIVGVFLCMGYMTGSDWRGYEIKYNELSINNIWEGYTEYGYVLYMYIFKFLGFGFWHFFIITKWILLFVIFKFLEKYNPKRKYLSYAIFFAFFGLFYFIDNPMRNLIGAVIYIFSYRYILEKNFQKYTLICIFASLFHLSFLLFIPIYFLLNRNVKTKTYVFAFVFLNIVLLLLSDQIINAVKFLEIFNYEYSGRLNQQISGYILSEEIKDKPFTFGMLSRYIIFVLLLVFRKHIESHSKYGKIIFNASIFLIFISRLNLVWPITIRFSIPFSIFYSISFSIIIMNLKNEMKLLIYSFFFIISVGTIYSTITGSYKYLPYSNYLEYIFVNKPDYNYRANYNFVKSPYKDKR